MAQDVFVYPKPVVDYDDKFAGPVQVPSGGTAAALTTVLSYQVKPGKACFIAVIANDVDAGGIGSVNMTVKVNGISLKDYVLGPNQWSSPQLITRLPVRIPVNQLAMVTVEAYNSAGSNYNAFARMLFEYEDF